MSGRPTAEIVADLRDWADNDPECDEIACREAADRLAEYARIEADVIAALNRYGRDQNWPDAAVTFVAAVKKAIRT